MKDDYIYLEMLAIVLKKYLPTEEIKTFYELAT
jgi:hypothetical protein